MITVRECPWCPATVPEGETTFAAEATPDGWRMKATRPLWEVYMAEHIVAEHPAQAAALSDDLVAEVRRQAEDAMSAMMARLTTALGTGPLPR